MYLKKFIRIRAKAPDDLDSVDPRLKRLSENSEVMNKYSNYSFKH